MRTIHACMIVPVVAALCGCGGEPPAMRVGAAAFTADELAELDPDRRALLADIAALGTLAASGALDTLAQPFADRAAHRSRLAALPYELAARAAVGEDSLRTLYAETPEWELTVRHVVRLVPAGADGPEREAQLAIAREVERRARGGEDLAALAAELSQEPGAGTRGGALAPARRGSWVDPFWEAAVALRPGEVSPVVESPYGYHVIRLDARRPVPYEEADRLRLLRRVLTPVDARLAMEAWAPTRPPVVLDPPAVLAARRALVRGEAPDTLIVSRSPEGDVVSAADLAVARAALDPDERRELDRSDDGAFGMWVQDEARGELWADEAERLGVAADEEAGADAKARWMARLAATSTALGLAEGMPGDAVAPAALRALQLGGQEALIARNQLPGLRPLLRAVYPATADSGTSSEIRKSWSSG